MKRKPPWTTTACPRDSPPMSRSESSAPYTGCCQRAFSGQLSAIGVRPPNSFNPEANGYRLTADRCSLTADSFVEPRLGHKNAQKEQTRLLCILRLLRILAAMFFSDQL